MGTGLLSTLRLERCFKSLIHQAKKKSKKKQQLSSHLCIVVWVLITTKAASRVASSNKMPVVCRCLLLFFFLRISYNSTAGKKKKRSLNGRFYCCWSQQSLACFARSITCGVLVHKYWDGACLVRLHKTTILLCDLK